ncbi:hypothetical protein [Syntrophomonas palmitatica]|uniref:hypothetical protein n=1 Tax=Syntrophomonas palmitatica TaxID=402877 RepID=UPI0006CF994E|nr:hypothetical protein [Syntrophomonas palmitatica]
MQRNKPFVLIIMLLLLMATGGCEQQAGKNDQIKTTPKPVSEKNPAVMPVDYFPLNKGAKWSYQGSGNEFASFTREVLFTKGNFAQVREANGGTTSISVYTFDKSALTRVYFQGENYDSQNILAGGFTPNDNTIFLQTPIKVGNSWKSDDRNQRKIVSLKAQVSTPAGEFKNCLQVKISGPDYVVYEYYQQDVGLIKREFLADQEAVTSALESYSLK